MSNLSFLEEDLELGAWLGKLEAAATFVQSVWRGYFFRKLFNRALLHKAAVVIQSNLRAYWGRIWFDEYYIWAMAVRIQCMFRCYVAKSRYETTKMEAEWHEMMQGGRGGGRGKKIKAYTGWMKEVADLASLRPSPIRVRRPSSMFNF